jgi:phosphoenolpyruvate synthase/pyruvate phosphate dikinase
MFFEGDRIDHVREMILGSLEFKSVEREMKALDSELNRATSPKKRAELTALRRKLKKEIEEPRRLYKGGLAQLLKLQRRDFEGIFRAMDGLPVTIRTLDPPCMSSCLTTRRARVNWRESSRPIRGTYGSAFRCFTKRTQCLDTAAVVWESCFPR